VFGGDLTINHFGDFGTDDHGIGDQVMHGQLETASGLTLMAADSLTY
jgi:PhnB protein